MQRRYQMLGALAALGLIGGLSWHGVFGDEPSDVVSGILEKTGERQSDLPDLPSEWRGRVDYVGLDRQLTELTSRAEMAGLAVAVVEAGELRFIGTYGVVDKSTGTPVTPKTVFRWASVSKTVAGTLAAVMASEGDVILHRPVASWKTSLHLPGGTESHVTLTQLLSQRTGLTKNAYDEKLEDGEDPRALRLMLAFAPQQCVPGTCHTYQNIAFDAASEILGQAAKRPFANSVSERFFLPLGMTSATYSMSGLTGARDWARPHNGSQVRTLKEAYWRIPAAAGVNSNIVDFSRWLLASMGKRADVLPASTLRLAQSPRVDTAPLYGGELRQAISDAGYGLGWRSFTYAGRRLVGHSGAVDGFRATMIFEPATRNGVVAMWNSNSGKPYRIPFAVFDSYHNRPDSNWLELGDRTSPRAEPARPSMETR